MCGRAQYPSGNVLGSEVLRDRVRAALRQWRDSVSEIVDTGIKRGEIRQGVDPKEADQIIKMRGSEDQTAPPAIPLPAPAPD